MFRACHSMKDKSRVGRTTGSGTSIDLRLHIWHKWSRHEFLLDATSLEILSKRGLRISTFADIESLDIIYTDTFPHDRLWASAYCTKTQIESSYSPSEVNPTAHRHIRSLDCHSACTTHGVLDYHSSFGHHIGIGPDSILLAVFVFLSHFAINGTSGLGGPLYITLVCRVWAHWSTFWLTGLGGRLHCVIGGRSGLSGGLGLLLPVQSTLWEGYQK